MFKKMYKKLYKNSLQDAERVTLDKEQLELDGYFSQYGQDKWLVENVFTKNRKGIFVDVGAYDGVTFSNTYYFEKNLGWTGLAIEPIPALYEQLTQNRTCTAINGCVAAQSKMTKFRHISGYAEMLSGISASYSKEHEDRIRDEVSKFGGDIEEIEVPCFGINDLLNSQQLFKVDYLSIDVEGSEEQILSALDFRKFKIAVIGVENNYQSPNLFWHLRMHGYRPHAIIGKDEIYVHNSFS